MPHSYYRIIFKDGTLLETTNTKIADNAMKLDSVKSIILRVLSETGWKETKIK